MTTNNIPDGFFPVAECYEVARKMYDGIAVGGWARTSERAIQAATGRDSAALTAVLMVEDGVTYWRVVCRNYGASAVLVNCRSRRRRA